MKNIDKVDLKNLKPNKADDVGWEDTSSGKNYWLIQADESIQVSPMIVEDIVEIRPVPLCFL